MLAATPCRPVLPMSAVTSSLKWGLVVLSDPTLLCQRLTQSSINSISKKHQCMRQVLMWYVKHSLFCRAGSAGVDADFALALQLQEEEQRQAARDQQARQQAQQQHQQQQQQQGRRGVTQSRHQQPTSRLSQPKGGAQGRPPSGRPGEQGSNSQSLGNPVMHRHRHAGPQQAPQQQAERSASSTIAKWFGWGSKK